MIRAAIAVQEKASAELIEQCLRAFEPELGTTFYVSRFAHSQELAAHYMPIYDFAFLDAAQSTGDKPSPQDTIRELDSAVMMVLVADSDRLALSGYEIEALGVVVNPPEQERLMAIIRRGIRRMLGRDDYYWQMSVPGGMIRLDTRMITYIESERHHITVHTDNRDYAVTTTMKELERNLADKHFFRSNHGYLVNLVRVSAVHDNIVSVEGRELIISRTRRKAFIEALNEYLGIPKRG